MPPTKNIVFTYFKMKWCNSFVMACLQNGVSLTATKRSVWRRRQCKPLPRTVQWPC